MADDTPPPEHATSAARPLVQDGHLSIAHLHTRRRPWDDAYHRLLTASWLAFIGWAFLAYVLINAIFAGLFLVGGDCYNAGGESGWLAAFSFSIQTLTTIGYGSMVPTTPWADSVVALESFVGVLYVALFSGLCFAKFGRPTARVAFSRFAVIQRFHDRPCLMVRMANERNSRIVDARVHLYALVEETSPEGIAMRRFYPLQLERHHSPVFGLSWVVMHYLDDDSVLSNGVDAPQPSLVALILTVTGVEGTTMQTVYSQHTYARDAIQHGRRFADVMCLIDGVPTVDHSKLHETVPDPTWGA